MSRDGVSAWRARVGTLYNLGGPNEEYTATYGGTSGASPIVAGGCALLQSVFKAKTGGNVLLPAQIRQVLVNTVQRSKPAYFRSPSTSGLFPI